ncbi:MAG: glutathione synthase [Candidatus Azotimanducaceae bacterium]|jgi:glutathione synthase
MKRFALLIRTTPAIDDTNYPRLARQLDLLGFDVDALFMDSLCLKAGKIYARGFPWDPGLGIHDPFPDPRDIEISHDYVWVLGFGDRSSFLDKYQLLYALPMGCQVINSLNAIMHMNSKYLLATHAKFKNPETWASTNAHELIEVVRRNPGYWIAKPPAGSLGRDVFKIDRDDSNLSAIIQNLCGPENTNYTLLQRYVPEIEQGEKRVLIAGGRVIDQYLRTPVLDHRTNVHQGAKIAHCTLSKAQSTLCQTLAELLLEEGVYFAGIDLAYPWLIEVNVVNPGGIATIAELTEVDRSEAVCHAILESLGLEF